MATELIGVEFGSSTLKLAQRKHNQLQQLAVCPLPRGLMEDGRITDPAALSAFLRHVWKTHAIRGRDCALVLPTKCVLSQHLTLPLMDKAALEAQLPQAFQDYLDREKRAYLYDYIVTGIRDSQVSLYAAAVPQDLLDTYRDSFQKAGLRLRLAIPPEMAWRNLILRQTTLPENLAILDLGHSTTRIQIFSGTHYRMGKEIPSARKFAADWEELAREIRRVINFYNYSLLPGESPVNSLYYCGGFAGLEPLRQALENSPDLTFLPISHLLDLPGEHSALHWAIAAGAAVQHL